MQRTIRDELLVDDDEGDEVSPRPPKGSTRWKGLLGLKRSHIGSKKVDKSEGSMERSVGESRNLLGINKIIRKGDSRAHGRAMTFVLGVVHV
jgi:hypothetical protein